MYRSIRNSLTVLLAAAALLGLSGISQAQQQQQQQGSAQNQASQSSSQMGQAGNQNQPQLPQGITPKDYGNVRGDVRDTFSSLVKAALTKDSFNDLRDQLAKADRDRLASTDNKYPDELDHAIDQFDQAWKGKYNASFGIDKDSAYPDQFLAVATGEVTNPQQVSQWPVTPEQQKGAPQTSNPTMNQGTGVAVATFAGQPNQPPIHVSFVREGNDWKIDIPDSVTADQLKDNLAKQLTEVNNMQNQWPQDKYEAQRIVTSHILMALYNLQSGQGGQSSQQPSSSQGQQGQQQGQSAQPSSSQGQQGQSSSQK